MNTGRSPPNPNARSSDGCWPARTIGSGAGSWGSNMPKTPSSTHSSSASATPPPDPIPCGSPCRSRYSGDALGEMPPEAIAAIAAPTQIVWRPSAWVIGALWSFGPLGAISLLASDLPALAAWPAALLVMVLAIRAANREAARPPRLIAWPTHGPPTVDGQPLHDARLQWRGPLAFLQWRQEIGRAHV